MKNDIACDYAECNNLPIYVCQCDRCRIEPDDEEKFHCCEKHYNDVARDHWNMRGREATWQPWDNGRNKMSENENTSNKVVDGKISYKRMFFSAGHLGGSTDLELNFVWIVDDGTKYENGKPVDGYGSAVEISMINHHDGNTSTIFVYGMSYSAIKEFVIKDIIKD